MATDGGVKVAVFATGTAGATRYRATTVEAARISSDTEAVPYSPPLVLLLEPLAPPSAVACSKAVDFS